jgi:archaellum biogenesis protein FlaJ (TadC family)
MYHRYMYIMYIHVVVYVVYMKLHIHVYICTQCTGVPLLYAGYIFLDETRKSKNKKSKNK